MRNHIVLLILIAFLISTDLVVAGESVLSEDAYKAISLAQESLQAGKYHEAHSTIQRLLEKKSLHDYDRAVALQTVAYIYHGLGQDKKAVRAFKEALGLGVLPDKVTHTLRYALAQSLIAIKNFAEGLVHLEKWFAEEGAPRAEAEILAAMAYYHTGDAMRLIEYAERAIEKTSTVPLMWYQLLLTGYDQAREYRRSIPLLHRALLDYPREKYLWLQLTANYQRIEKEKEALSTLDLAYKAGLLNIGERIRLAEFYFSMSLPYQAALILQETAQLDEGEAATKRFLNLLANSWMMAKEYARAEKPLLELVGMRDSNAAAHLARIYIGREDWQAVYDLLTPFFKVKKESVDAKLSLYYGIAAYFLGKRKQARQYLQNALQHKATRDDARNWLARVNDPSFSTE